MKEGYIKFQCTRINSNLVTDINEINKWRNKLYYLNLIGMYKNGIGFGNISVRNKNGFIITGSKTGGIEKLTKEHYTRVIGYNFGKNNLVCIGKIDASSESLTHAAIYQSDLNINAVIHIHNLRLWNNLKNKIPTTSEQVEYGTPEMAEEISRLYKETDVKKKKILVMGGHKEGIISFGKSLNEAGNVLLNYYENLKI
jgi:L-ribulose-5-phosphate 4-epimerase